MPRSFLDQALQVAASATYDDGVSNPHTVGVAEGQTELEGDLNLLRTLIKDDLGITNWYDSVDLSLQGVSNRFFIEQLHPSSLDNVATGTGGNTTAFDTAIQSITNHNDGGGNSTTEGVVVNSTKAHRLEIRDHDTQDPIDDGSGNEVYGRLSWTGTAYSVTWYSWVSGTETAYTFTTSVGVDLSRVIVSRPYKNLSWDVWLMDGWHDVAGFAGTILDDNVTVNGMTYLLSGLTTQAQLNVKLDKLGSTANGEGASGIAVEDASGYYTGADVEALFNELETQIGGATSTTYDFTENNVLADNDPIYTALNKLDLKWGDLASTSVGEGASLVGSNDAGGYYTSNDVESILQEIGQKIEDVSGWEKVWETTASPISSGSSHTLPSSATYTLGSGANLDVYLDGQLLMEGASNDYQEVSTTQVAFNFTVPTGKNIIYMIRK